jgi:hypothetical protein
VLHGILELCNLLGSGQSMGRQLYSAMKYTSEPSSPPPLQQADTGKLLSSGQLETLITMFLPSYDSILYMSHYTIGNAVDCWTSQGVK